MGGAPFDEEGLALSRYGRLRWNTPLSESHADLLLDRLAVRSAGSILDLGCGWGELLLRAVRRGGLEDDGQVTGVGVDTDRSLLDRAQALAAERGLERRVRFVPARAESWEEPADRVLCI